MAAALLGLATPTTPAAQGTGAAVSGPVSRGQDQPAEPRSIKAFVDSVNIDLGYTYDDNVTLGRTDDDILWDQSLTLDASASRAFRMGDHARLVVTGLLNGAKFDKYNGLSNVSGGLEAEIQYRRSGAFDAITYAAFARGWLLDFVELAPEDLVLLGHTLVTEFGVAALPNLERRLEHTIELT